MGHRVSTQKSEVRNQRSEDGGQREVVGGWRSAALEVGGKWKIIAKLSFGLPPFGRVPSFAIPLTPDTCLPADLSRRSSKSEVGSPEGVGGTPDTILP
jgi:hypothetical protein